MNRFSAVDLPLAGLKRIDRRRLADERGFLSRVFCASELADHGWQGPVEQVNLTHTNRQGTVRGLHFQHSPHCEVKLVSVTRGEVWDVAVDLRRGSATFLQWHAERLSAGNDRALLIPEGFAHGFQALTDDVDMVYCHSAPYRADAEAGLNPLDPALGINWPLPIAVISDRDSNHPRLGGGFAGVELP